MHEGIKVKFVLIIVLIFLSKYNTPFIQFTGIQSAGKTVSMLIRASNENLLAEAERSIHDALCVLRCLVKKRALLAGGGAGNFD